MQKTTAIVLIKKDFLYIFYVIRKPESISWLRSQRRRKHMKEERRKWNARELFLDWSRMISWTIAAQEALPS